MLGHLSDTFHTLVIGVFTGYAMGGLIHILLVIAVIVLIVGLIQRRGS